MAEKLGNETQRSNRIGIVVEERFADIADLEQKQTGGIDESVGGKPLFMELKSPEGRWEGSRVNGTGRNKQRRRDRNDEQ